MVGVVIFSLVKNRKAVTAQSFASLYEKTTFPFLHIVIDQGSDQETKEYLEWLRDERDDVLLYRNEENVGISRGTNQALDIIQRMNDSGCPVDVIIKYDNDCVIITPGALDACVRFVMDYPAFVVSPYVDGLVMNKGGAPRIGFSTLGGANIGLTRHIGGIVTVAAKKAWDSFGRHRVPAPLHGGQDGEFSSKLVSLGYSFGYLEDVKVLHSDNEFNSNDKEYWSLRKDEKERFK